MSQFRDLNNKEIKESLSSNFGVTSANRGKGPNGTPALQGSEMDKAANILKNGSHITTMLDSIDKYNAAQSNASKGIGGLINGMQKFGSVVIGIFDNISRVMTRVLIVISVVQLAFSAIRAIWGEDNMFDNLLKSVMDVGAQLLGLNKSAQALKKSFSDIADVELTKNFNKMGLKDTDQFTYDKTFMNSGFFTTETVEDQASMSKKLSSVLQNAYKDMKLVNGARIAGAFNQDNFGESIQKQIDILENEYVPSTYAAARAQQALVNSLKELKEAGPGAYDALKVLSMEFGISAQQFTKSFKASDFKREINSVKMAATGLGGDQINLSMFTTEGLKEQKKLIEKNNRLPAKALKDQSFGEFLMSGLDGGPDKKTIDQQTTKLGQVNEFTGSVLATKAFQDSIADYLKSKNVNADGLSQMESGLNNVIEKARALASLANDPEAMNMWHSEINAASSYLRVLERIQKTTEESIAKSQYQLTLGTQLAKTFQSEISAGQEFGGLVDKVTGKLAIDSKDVRAITMKNLGKMIDYGDQNPDNGAAVANANTGRNILKGLYIKTSQDVKNINQELAKDLVQLHAQAAEAISNLYRTGQLAAIQSNQSALNQLKATYDYEIALLDLKGQMLDAQSKGATIAIQSQINALNSAKAILDEEEKAVQLKMQAKNIAMDIALLEKNKGLTFASELSDTFTNLFSDAAKSDIKLALNVSNLDKLIATIDNEVEALTASSEIKKQQLDLEEQIAKKQYEMAAAQGGSEVAKIAIEEEKLKLTQKLAEDEKKYKLDIILRQENIAKEENTMLLAKIEADRSLRALEQGIIDQRIKLIKDEADVLNEHVRKLAEVISLQIAHAELMSPAEGSTEEISNLIQSLKPTATVGEIVKTLSRNIIQPQIMGDIGNIKTGADEAERKAAEAKKVSETLADKQKENANDQLKMKLKELSDDRTAFNLKMSRQEDLDKKTMSLYDQQKKNAGASVDAAYKEYESQLQLIASKRANGETELGNELKKAEFNKKDLEYQKERALAIAALGKDPFFKFANDFIGIVKNDMTKGLKDLNKAFIDGTLTWQNFGEGLKDWTVSFLKNTQEALIQRAIIEPLTNYVQDSLTSFVMDMFKVDINKPKIEGALVSVNGGLALRTTSSDAANPTGAAGVGTFNGKVLSESEIKEQSATSPGGWFPGREALTPEELAQGTEATGTWAEQAGAIQVVNDKAQESSGILSNLGSKMGDWSIAITGSLASVLAAGGDFSKALPGIFASLFGQILKDALSASSSGGGGAGGGAGGLLGGLFGKIGGLFGGSEAISAGSAMGTESIISGAGGLAGGWMPGFSSGGSIQKFNSGGEVQKHLESVTGLASGGRAGRDNVPAMLEPGEFVIRKSAAQKLGMNKLTDLNNHGDNASWLDTTRPATMSAPVAPMIMPMPVAAPAAPTAAPNVSVNVTNTGTQQEMQGKPSVRMNGTQMIIDVVTRDFANNGPIRQSMRGNNF
jgi:hypothetical protein